MNNLERKFKMHQNNGNYKTFDYQPLHIGSSLKQLSTGYNQIYFLNVAKIDTCADDYKLTHSRQRQRYLKKKFDSRNNV